MILNIDAIHMKKTSLCRYHLTNFDRQKREIIFYSRISLVLIIFLDYANLKSKIYINLLEIRQYLKLYFCFHFSTHIKISIKLQCDRRV